MIRPRPWKLYKENRELTVVLKRRFEWLLYRHYYLHEDTPHLDASMESLLWDKRTKAYWDVELVYRVLRGRDTERKKRFMMYLHYEAEVMKLEGRYRRLCERTEKMLDDKDFDMERYNQQLLFKKFVSEQYLEAQKNLEYCHRTSHLGHVDRFLKHLNRLYLVEDNGYRRERVQYCVFSKDGQREH